MLTFDISYFASVFPQILEALPFTFWVIFMSSVICLLVGSAMAIIRIAKIPILVDIYQIWLSFVRSMPFILLLFLIYFTFPFVVRLVGFDVSRMDKVNFIYITLAFAYGPIIAEVIRPAYEAVDRGQHEAAIVFGYSTIQRIIHIIAPQAMVAILPPMVNQIIEIVKDTSLMYFIGLTDLMGRTNLLITLNQGKGKLENYIAVAIVYWAIIAGLELLSQRLEKYNIRMFVREIS